MIIKRVYFMYFYCCEVASKRAPCVEVKYEQTCENYQGLEKQNVFNDKYLSHVSEN